MLMLLSIVTSALALDVENPASGGAGSGSKTTAEYLSDLSGDNAPERLYAARALRNQLRTALRVEIRAKPGSFAHDEARAALVELDDRLPSSCRAALAFPNTVAPCADILALLEVADALPLLEEKLAIEERKGVRKRLERAIAALRAP